MHRPGLREEQPGLCAPFRFGRMGAPCFAHRPCLGEFGLSETENRPNFAQRPGLGEIAGFLAVRVWLKPQVTGVLLGLGSPKQGSWSTVFLPSRDVVSKWAPFAAQEADVLPSRDVAQGERRPHRFEWRRLSQAGTMRAQADACCLPGGRCCSQPGRCAGRKAAAPVREALPLPIRYVVENRARRLSFALIRQVVAQGREGSVPEGMLPSPKLG